MHKHTRNDERYSKLSSSTKEQQGARDNEAAATTRRRRRNEAKNSTATHQAPHHSHSRHPRTTDMNRCSADREAAWGQLRERAESLPVALGASLPDDEQMLQFPDIPGLFFVPEFLSQEEEAVLLRQLYDAGQVRG